MHPFTVESLVRQHMDELLRDAERERVAAAARRSRPRTGRIRTSILRALAGRISRGSGPLSSTLLPTRAAD